MRTDQVIENNKKLSKDCKLDTDKGRQLAILSVLTDINETQALFVDLFAAIYGRTIQFDPKNQVGRET